MEKGPTDADLDDLLDDALDDFDDDTTANKKAESELPKVVEEGHSKVAKAKQEEMNALQENMAKFFEDAQNPEFQSVLEQAFRELSNESGENGSSELQSLLGSLSMAHGDNDAEGNGGDEKSGMNYSPPGQNGSDVDIGVAQTLQNLAKAAEDMEGMDPEKAEFAGEELMENMMKQFEEMGEKKDFHGIVDNMMQQLLSKEVMYEPMKQICDKYPEWLAEQEALLPKEEYERYGKQYQFFQQIVAVYEHEPDNIERLTELMQDMQECGQPPADIVKELAPGLEFDDSGMPIMPNMGPGMMPGMGGSAGFPVGAQLPGQEQCCLM